ncbi:MAG: prepilin-type N-terminal cleavage/methylation domain-containing protein, partial [Akkermansiaceae bacterium]|nr:prepilin-type N-terminal cleavage/methylation domain-containing protein [Akkermansiaceae bacterium]
MQRHARRLHGFSLVEVLVALGVLSIISFYISEMLSRQSKAYQVVDQVTEAQQ